MAQYITEASVERDGVEIPLELHFKAEREEGRLFVDARSVTGYRNGDLFPLRKAEMFAFAVELERV